MSKVPIRTCVYTRIKKEKEKLLRLVKNDENIYVIDYDKKIQSRGIYIDLSEKVMVLIDKNKKYNISDSDKEIIKDMIKNKLKVGGKNVK